ncbi:MAG: carboxypeptidase-like regulatory domain-containing protein, partial [Firmicutes bacterium]|nr:carboxypeptidase-like regulatory domain-containing protein [Bacillota bacterium]
RSVKMMRKSVLRCLFPILVLAMVLAGCGGGGGGGTTPPAEMATISGVITGSSPDLLIPGATVTAAGGGRTITTVSGPDGRYTLHAPAATYAVTVAKESYQDASAEIVVAAGESLTHDFALVTGSGGTPELPADFQSNLRYCISTDPAECEPRGMVNRGKIAARPVFGTRPPAGRQGADYHYIVGIYAESYRNQVPPGALGVRIYQSDVPGGPFALVACVPWNIEEIWAWADFYHTDPALSPEAGKYYAVSIYGAGGETPITTPVEIVPLAPCLLGSPAQGEVHAGLRPTFSWTPPEGADRLWLYLYDSNGGWVGDWGFSGAATQWSLDRDLTPGVTYYWFVDAYKSMESANMWWYSVSYYRTFTVTAGP